MLLKGKAQLFESSFNHRYSSRCSKRREQQKAIIQLHALSAPDRSLLDQEQNSVAKQSYKQDILRQYFANSGKVNSKEEMDIVQQEASIFIENVSSEVNTLVRDQSYQYDHKKLAQGINKKRGKVLRRAVVVSFQVSRFITLILADVAQNKVKENYLLRANQLVKMLTELGPAFVKVGQALSSRPDLLPREYLDALQQLQDQLPPFPRDHAIFMMQDELKDTFNQIEVISDQPVAAASLGQVFKAKLKNGQDVAIKVQRPGIGEGIAVDMVLIRSILRGIDDYLNPFSQPLVPLLDEFAAKLFKELDYIQEGHNCIRFTELYSHIPRIRTPKIYWELTSSRVLTMEWIEGVKLTNLEAIKSFDTPLLSYVDVGIECSLKQLLEHGYFHADPHPGNLLATKEGDLVYLDFGMMSEAPKRARDAIIAHIVHLVNRDYEAMCMDYYTLDFIDPDIDTKPIAPALAAFFDDVLDKSIDQLNFRRIIDGLGNVLYSYPFSIPSYYALILKSLTILEGLAIRSDKNYKLLGKAYPYVATRILVDPSPQLRQSFNELILKDGRFRWNRLENLLRESGKRNTNNDNVNDDSVWLLIKWTLSESARPVREQFLHDIIRMIDALTSDQIRSILINQYGQTDLAYRLMPYTSGEVQDSMRARRLIDVLQLQFGSRGRDQADVIREFVQNPLGSASIFNPNQIQENFQNTINRLSQLSPRFREVINLPGSQQSLNIITSQLTQRFTARTVKFSIGLGQTIQGGLQSNNFQNVIQNIFNTFNQS